MDLELELELERKIERGSQPPANLSGQALRTLYLTTSFDYTIHRDENWEQPQADTRFCGRNEFLPDSPQTTIAAQHQLGTDLA